MRRGIVGRSAPRNFLLLAFAGLIALVGQGCSSSKAPPPAISIDGNAESSLSQTLAAAQQFAADEVNAPEKLGSTQATVLARMTDEDATVILATYASLLDLHAGQRFRSWSLPVGFDALIAKYSDLPYFDQLTGKPDAGAGFRKQSFPLRLDFISIPFTPQCSPPGSSCEGQAYTSVVAALGATVLYDFLNELFPENEVKLVTNYVKSCLFEQNCSQQKLLELALALVVKSSFRQLKVMFLILDVAKGTLDALATEELLEQGCEDYQTKSCCTAPSVQCLDTCIDVSSDESNCGSCGATCRGDQVCNSGHCGCLDNKSDCNGQCAVLALDFDNCGSCGSKCDIANGVACADGVCACVGATCMDGGACQSGDQQCPSPGLCCPTDETCCGALCCPTNQGWTCMAGQGCQPPPDASLSEGGGPDDGGGTSDDSGDAGCDSNSCPNGCCDSQGGCQAGTDDTACGSGGQTCIACTGSDTCGGGGPPQTCGGSNDGGPDAGCDSNPCPNGCCDSQGMCQSGTDDTACGSGGQGCAACMGSDTCMDEGMGGMCGPSDGGSDGSDGGDACVVRVGMSAGCGTPPPQPGSPEAEELALLGITLPPNYDPTTPYSLVVAGMSSSSAILATSCSSVSYAEANLCVDLGHVIGCSSPCDSQGDH